MSDVIANMILEMLEEGGDAVQIQRNDLAQKLGCVPSQINYVITSRFTPEQGYRVESKRGGGGYILISRSQPAHNPMLMHVLNSIGDTLDEGTCRAHIMNLVQRGYLSEEQAKLMLAAANESAYRQLPPQMRGVLRCQLLKQMLLTAMQ